MFTVLLSGRIATGKSIIANTLASFGIKIIDADEIARTVTKFGTKKYNAIINKFGTDILNDDQTLNRLKLREIIFNDSKARTWLEKCLHPETLTIISQQINQCTLTDKYNYIVIAIPLLINKQNLSEKYNIKIDKTIIVDSNENNQLARLLSRDNISEQLATKMLNAQAPRKKYIEIADHVIENNKTKFDLIAKITSLHKDILQIFS